MYSNYQFFQLIANGQIGIAMKYVDLENKQDLNQSKLNLAGKIVRVQIKKIVTSGIALQVIFEVVLVVSRGAFFTERTDEFDKLQFLLCLFSQIVHKYFAYQIKP